MPINLFTFPIEYIHIIDIYNYSEKKINVNYAYCSYNLEKNASRITFYRHLVLFLEKNRQIMRLDLL